jgi:hypothetical protein
MKINSLRMSFYDEYLAKELELKKKGINSKVTLNWRLNG